MLKVCVVGDAGVGKTSLVRRLAGDLFTNEYITTKGAEARPLTISLGVSGFAREYRCKVALWDVTGHGGASRAVPFLRGARAALVVGDATRIETQLNMWKWVEALRGAAGRIPMVLVLNKSELAQTEGCPAIAGEIAAEYGLHWLKASALTGHNLLAAFSGLLVRCFPPDAFIGGAPVWANLFARKRPAGGRPVRVPAVPRPLKAGMLSGLQGCDLPARACVPSGG
jgi:small GTP-binding protein